jgi:hypothetical protein
MSKSEQESGEVLHTRRHYAYHTAKHLLIVTAIASAGAVLVARTDPQPLVAAGWGMLVWELFLRNQILEYGAHAVGVVFPSRAEVLRDEI